MNLYLFESYDNGYHGGAIGVIARNYDDAIKLIMDIKWESPHNNESKYKNDVFGKTFPPRDKTIRKEDYRTKWILNSEFSVSDELIPGVILENWSDG